MACSLGGCENPLHAPCSWYSQDRQVLGTCSYYCKNTNTATAFCVKLSVSRDRATPMPCQPADLTQSPQRCERWQKLYEIRQDWTKYWGSFPREVYVLDPHTQIQRHLLFSDSSCCVVSGLKLWKIKMWEKDFSRVLCTQSHSLKK